MCHPLGFKFVAGGTIVTTVGTRLRFSLRVSFVAYSLGKMNKYSGVWGVDGKVFYTPGPGPHRPRGQNSKMKSEREGTQEDSREYILIVYKVRKAVH
jgi:hypothetical protein